MEHPQEQPTACPDQPADGRESSYQAPAVTPVGSFATDTRGDVSVGQSDDSDAGQYYAQ
ncbi:hypothetical protein GCM10009801_09130 [Streptomyces albiaxialis]|uniref:Uncharacterized protein n=1 Tax=Streptomyces albiaxialis TaxID=329523 RepID=A0ABN2VKW2_9ACTN